MWRSGSLEPTRRKLVFSTLFIHELAYRNLYSQLSRTYPGKFAFVITYRTRPNIAHKDARVHQASFI